MEENSKLQTPRRNWKRIIKAAILGIVVFVFIFMLWNYVPMLGSGEADTCVKCHSMVPEYMTWQQSNHSQFQCKECHQESGVTNFLKYQGKLAKEMFLYRSGSEPVKKVSNPVSSSACLKCHSVNREYTASSDTVIPHDKHLAKGIECTACHSGVAHGRIVERGITEKIPVEQWNSAIALEQMDFKYTTPRMDVCLDCHAKRKIDMTCSTCHSKQVVPASHKSKGWESQHGKDAKTDFKPCNLCHVYTLNKSVDLNEMTLPDYIKANSYCYNCHLNKPSTHKDPDFGEVHGTMVQSRGISNCLSCHDIDKPKGNENRGPINQVYCNKCHWFK